MTHQPTYSTIIDPASYNLFMSQHWYIPEADQAIQRLLDWEVHRFSRGFKARVLEIGCGPARILPLLASTPGTQVEGIDYDPAFVKYGQELLSKQNISSRIIQADLKSFKSEKKYQVIVSQGFHHHLSKDEVGIYVEKIFYLLDPGGLYILGDEFLAPYSSTQERLIRAIIWYAHIIFHALDDGHEHLAREEVKTLLDDLAEGVKDKGTKNEKQIELVLSCVKKINSYAESFQRTAAEQAAFDLLRKIHQLKDSPPAINKTLQLSRGDYKLDFQHFYKSMNQAGFKLETIHTLGPASTIGCMSVFGFRT